MSPRSRRILVAAVLASGFVPSLASARIWYGGFSTQWLNGAAWDGFTVPSGVDTAAFNNNAFVSSTTVNIGGVTPTVSQWQVQGANFSFVGTGSAQLSSGGTALFGVAGGAGVRSYFASGMTLLFNQLQLAESTSSLTFSSVTGNFSSSISTYEGTTLAANNSTLSTNFLSAAGTSHINASGTNLTTPSLGIEPSAFIVLSNNSKLTLTDTITVAGTLTVNDTSDLVISSGKALAFTGTSGRLNLNRSYFVQNNASLNAIQGADFVTQSLLIGQNSTGSVNVSNAGTTITSTIGLSGVGIGAGANGTLDISDGAQVSFLRLQAGTTNGVSNITVGSNNAILQLTSTDAATNALEMGGGGTARNVKLTINTGGAVISQGKAVFNSDAVVALAGGQLQLNDDSGFYVGSKLDWTAGSLILKSGKTFTVTGTVDRHGVFAELTSGATLSLFGGGTFTGTGYYDIARGAGRSGSLLLSGNGTNFTAGGSSSDWGLGSGASANANLSNGATATLSVLNLGTSDAAASMGIGAGSTFTTTGAFNAGGGSAIRGVNVAVSGTLAVNGNAKFDQASALTLNTSGTIQVGGDLTFLARSNLSWIGGSVVVASGKTFAVSGGSVNRTSNSGTALSPGASLAITGGGTFTAANYFDITSGGLTVSDTSSKLTVGGITFTDWGSATGVPVSITNNGAANFTYGLRIGSNNTATVAINSGGKLTAQRLVVGGDATSSATINLSTAGTLNADTVTLGAGTVIQMSGGAFEVTNTLTMNGNALVTLTTGRDKTLHVGNLSMDGTSAINLGDNNLAIDAFQAADVVNVRSLLRTGYANGAWTGPGIRSSFAASHPGGAIGYSVGLGVFAKYTLAGDATLDAKVNFDDLVSLAQNYNKADQIWTQGDFTYDGIVNFDDLVPLAQNYNKTLPASLVAELEAIGGASFAADWALAQSLVPEPGVISISTAALSVLATRRRSRA